MRRLLQLLLLACTLPLAAQTTLTIPTTVKTANIPRLGINLGGGQTALSYYGPNQLFKNLNYAQGGDMPGFYWGVTYECNAGPNSVFNWSNDIADTQGYPTDFWAGATFTTVTKDTGTSIGSGTVSHSSANTTYPGSGVLLEGLNPQLSRACNATAEPPPTYIPYGDVLIARLLTPGSVALNLMTPNNFYGGFPSSSSWNTDTSPASTNTIHSLQLLTGTAASFADDAVLQNATNPNGSLANTYVPWINLNGNYSANFKAKCLTAGCTIGFSVTRLSGTTFVPFTVVSPTFNVASGVGWTTYTTPFTASETGAQGSGIYYVLSCTGTCLLQDADLIEGSTLAGNTTPFRDAVVSELEKLHPGSLRYMDSSQWCSDVADEIAPIGNRRWCGNSQYVSYVQGPPIGYDDFLQLANVVGADAWISVGITNGPSDWTTLINWLNSSGWVSTFNSAGHKIYLEYGNEPWNTGSTAQVVDGNGIAYGGLLGPNMTAARAAYTGSDSSVIKLVGDSWVAPDQGSTNFGWLNNMMQYAPCTNGTQTSCPDFVTNAPYTLNYLNNFDTTGSNVSTTGAPFLDEWAEISNIDSVTSTPSDWMYASGSMYLNTTYGLATYNVPMATYETNISTTNGNTVTQTQMNQIASSVGEGLAQAQHMLLQQRDSGVTGPINFFAFAQNYFNYNDTHPPAVGMWGCMIALGTGPGQAVNSANYERPACTLMGLVNQAIGSNNNLIASTQSGTPTFNYPGGQPLAGFAGTKNTILANAAVPLVNCFTYANSGKTAWTVICFNNNLTGTESVTLSGAGAPTGSVSQTIFPNSGNVITDNNEATYVGPSSLPLVVTYPSATSTSGTIYTIPAASMMALTYTTSGTPQAATPGFSPGTGAYAMFQTVTITSTTSGVSLCYTTDGSTPAAATPGTCSHGSTLTNGGTISVATTQTVNALATIASGFTNSSVNSAIYTINGPAPQPTLSPNGGSFGSAQPVTMTVASPCAGYGVYNTTNAQSGGNLTGTSSTTPFTVSMTSTYYVQTQGCPVHVNSSISSGIVFTISTTASTPSPAPAPGTYSGVSLSLTSTGSLICYNTTGASIVIGGSASCPGGSTAYTGPIPITSTTTVYAVGGGVSWTDSSLFTGTYTITSPTAATPTLSPNGGSFSGSQSVTASTSTSACTSYIVYNATGAQSGGNLTGTSSTNPFTVSSSGTYYTQVQGCPSYLNSSISSGITFTISSSAAAPTFLYGTGAYIGSRVETLSTGTAGCSGYIAYNTTGAQSGGNLTGVTVGTSYYVANPITYYVQVQSCPGVANSSIATAIYAFTQTTWYIRTDGGSRYSPNATGGQCNGHYDAAYPGSGVNQNCAFSDLRFMWDDQSTAGAYLWALAGGDTVLIRGCAVDSNQPYNASPSCRIGWDNNVSPGNGIWAKGRSNGGAHNPPIPPGTSSQHTRILGANYAACTKSNAQVIFGGFGVSWALDMTGGSAYVDTECLNITSHSEVVPGTTGICITHGTTVGNVPAACITGGSSLSDYDGNGIQTDNTTANILMQDLWITGHTASGLQGPIGGPITWNRVFVGFNGFAGWNFDDGTMPNPTPNAPGSSFTGSYVTMLGNGCNSEYPVTDTFPGLYCFDLNSGGFGDSFSGQQSNMDSFVCDHCTTNFNTKDGMIGPHVFLANLKYTNSSWTGNMGQQWKWNSQANSTAQMLNNVVNANCYRMSQPITGWPSSFNHYLTLYCRANADVASYSSAPGSSVLIANNTFTTYEKQIFDLGATTTGQCGTATQIFENNLFWGVTVATNYFPGASGSAPAVYFLSDGTCTYTPSYNLEFGVRNGSCPGSTFVCTDPLLNGEPAPGGIPPESAMDVFNPVSPGFQPSSSSPAKGAGTTYTGLLSSDFYGTVRTSPPVIGAVNGAASPPTGSSVILGGGVVFGGGTKVQ